jgi:L-fuculose-phosphate aldolase
MSAPQIRKAVSEYSLELHALGWVANHDGNVSAKSGDGERFFITPTATSKRKCPPDSIVECHLDGKPISRGSPPSEVALHAGAYRARPDAKAVIHAHPPYASAFALAGVELGPIAMPEVVVSLGDRIPLVPLLLPKDPAAGDAVGRALDGSDVMLLAGNGVLAIGDDLEQAFLRVELVEHYAKILTIARSVAAVPPLDAEKRERLLEMRKKAGLGRRAVLAKKPAAEAPAKAAEAPAPRAVQSTVRAVVAEEVRRALGVEK